MIEMQSLLADCDHWADTLPRASHGPAVAAWKSEPDSQQKCAALTEAFEGRLLRQREEGTPLHDQHLRYTKGRDPCGSSIAPGALPYDEEALPMADTEDSALKSRLELKRGTLSQDPSRTRAQAHRRQQHSGPRHRKRRLEFCAT